MKVLLVGAGGMGRVHARSWKQIPDVELTIFDTTWTKADELARAHGAGRATSFAAGIDECDAVDICTPTPQHFDYALQAAKAGKAVLCEKPILRTLERADELKEAVAQSGSLFMPGHVVRFFPNYRKAHDLIVAGEIGRPAAFTLHRGGKGPVGTDAWFQDESLSGGVLLDLAIHDFDWLLWTIGPVAELTSRRVDMKEVAGRDFALTTLKFECGAVAVVESTWMDPSGFHTWFDLSGSNGLLQHDSREESSLSLNAGSRSGWENPRAPGTDPYYLECKALRDAFVGEAPLAVTLDEGLAALKVSLAAIESARLKKSVRIQ